MGDREARWHRATSGQKSARRARRAQENGEHVHTAPTRCTHAIKTGWADRRRESCATLMRTVWKFCSQPVVSPSWRCALGLEICVQFLRHAFRVFSTCVGGTARRQAGMGTLSPPYVPSSVAPRSSARCPYALSFMFRAGFGRARPVRNVVRNSVPRLSVRNGNGTAVTQTHGGYTIHVSYQTRDPHFPKMPANFVPHFLMIQASSELTRTGT